MPELHLATSETEAPLEIWYRVSVRRRIGRKLSTVQDEIFVLAVSPDDLQAKLSDFKDKVDGYSIAKLHQCSICQKIGPWTDTWFWYGSWKQMDDGLPVIKICSPECECQGLESKVIPRNARRIDQDDA